MLICCPFIAKHGDSLIYNILFQVQFFAQRFHNQLLEVFGKEFQPVFVRQNNHVFGSFTVT